MGSLEGSIKTAARRLGLSVEEYRHNKALNLCWCRTCKTWRVRDAFPKDASRGDGTGRVCFSCNRVKQRVCTKGRPSAFRGRIHTAEAKAAMSLAKKGKPSARTGKKHTLETRYKISVRSRERAKRGPEAPGYIDGKGAERRGLRSTAALKQWRYDIFLRDGFACVHCGDDQGGNLEAHHILPFASYPEQRFDTSNGVTLCRGCHWLVHAYNLQLWSPIQ